MKFRLFSGAALRALMAVLGCVWLASARTAASASVKSLLLAGPMEKKSAVAIEVPARVLAFQVQVRTASDEWEVRLQETELVRSQLTAAAQKAGFRLEATNAVVLGQGYKGMSLVSSAGRSEIDVRSNLLLLAELDEKTDLVDVVRRARVLLTRTPLPKGATLALGEVKLGLEDPEAFRPELLKRIRTHIDATAGALGDGVEVEASGLDEAIVARQSGERNVELALPLRVTYSRKGK